MAASTNTDRIAALEKLSLTLEVRSDALATQVSGHSERLRESDGSIYELDKRLSVLAKQVEHLESKVEDSHAKRREIGKILIAAMVGALLTFLGGLISRWVEPRPADGQAGLRAKTIEKP